MTRFGRAMVCAGVLACALPTQLMAHGSMAPLNADAELHPIRVEAGQQTPLTIDLSEYGATNRPAAELARSTATSSDIVCVDPLTTKHVVLVYARPTDRPDRFAAIAPILRQETYAMSAFVRSEARWKSSSKDMKLHVKCVDGVPEVHQVALSTSTAASTFGTISADVQAVGYGDEASTAGREHAIVYADLSRGAGLLGIGQRFNDATLASTNRNLYGDGMAQVYAPSETGISSVPRWWVMLHELGHTFGAVTSTAPHTSDATFGGHCNDGYDLMCSPDGGAQSSYSSGSCAYIVWDCNGDDYFHPAPPGGSFLASSWNTGSTLNTYFAHGSVTPDGGAPSMPGALVVGSFQQASQSLDWTAAVDDLGVTGYAVQWFTASKGWRLAGVTTDATFPIGSWGGTHQFRVIAFDAAGNESVPASASFTAQGWTADGGSGAAATQTVGGGGSTTGGATGCGAPKAPRFSKVAVKVSSIAFAWTSDNAAGCIDVYGVRRFQNGAWKTLRETRSLDSAIAGLSPSTRVSIGIYARTAGGVRSPITSISAATRPDAKAPTRPGTPFIAKRGGGKVAIGWGRSVDDWRVAKYVLQTAPAASGPWRTVSTVPATATRSSLRRPRPMHVRVRAIDAARKASGWSRALSVS